MKSFKKTLKEMDACEDAQSDIIRDMVSYEDVKKYMEKL